MAYGSLCRFACHAILVAVCSASLLIGSGGGLCNGQEVKNRQGDAEAARKELSFRVYAQWAIDRFDSDNDGSLTHEEMKKMASPLLEVWYDKNNDDKLSFEEIVEAIRKPSSAIVQEQGASESGTIKIDSKFAKYAESSIRQYDEDKDGFLSLDEVRKMRRPLPSSADSNKDGRFSSQEIAHFFANPKSKIGKQRPLVVVNQTPALDSHELAERFLIASLKKNDKNGNGKLDANEIVAAKWSTIRWQDSDSNDDGEISREELRARYRQMFSQLEKGAQLNRAATERQLDKESARQSAEFARRAADEANRQNELIQRMLIGTRGESKRGLSGMLASEISSKRAKPMAKTSSSNAFVDVELYLIRLPVNSDAERLANAVEQLSISTEKTADAVKDLAQQIGVKNYDQLVFSSMNQRQTSVVSGASVPRTTGVTQSTRGRILNQQFVDVGFSVKVTPEIQNDRINLAVEIEKSDLIVNDREEDQTPDNFIVNWTFDSTIQIRDTNPAIIGSSSSGQHWILVADANRD